MKKNSPIFYCIIVIIFITISSATNVLAAGQGAGTPCSSNGDCSSDTCDFTNARQSNNYQGICTAPPSTTKSTGFNLIPCGTHESGGVVTDQCDLNSFIVLVRNVINALFIISIPLATVSFVAIGIMLLFSQGNPTKIQRAKSMAWSILIGFIIILSAWLIVYTITHALLNSNFPSYLKP